MNGWQVSPLLAPQLLFILLFFYQKRADDKCNYLILLPSESNEAGISRLEILRTQAHILNNYDLSRQSLVSVENLRQRGATFFP